MAIVTIFLFVLVAGIVDIGRALYAYIGVQEAAQEGAIFGSFDPNGDIIGRAIDAVEFPDLSAAGSSVAVTCPGGDLVEVTVTHDVDLITPIVGQWFGPTISLSRTVTGQVFVGSCVANP
jgi:Flp pilus assembly protein TadG